MTKPPSMVSHNNYNLSVAEAFAMFLTSKLFAYFIDSFTLKRESQLVAHLLNGSEHINWILDLEDEVHSIWVTTTSRNESMRVFDLEK